MKKRNVRPWLAAGLVAGLAVVLLTRPREPEHRGVGLSDCLDLLESGKREDREKAAEALRGMGSNAVPVLVAMIGAKDSTLKQRLAVATARFPIFKYSYRLPGSRLPTVVEALGTLRQPGAPADPALVALLDRPDRSLAALSGLMALGVEDKGVYSRALLDPHPVVRQTAAAALSRAGEGKPVRHPSGVAFLVPGTAGAAPQRVPALGIGSRADISPSVVVPVLVDYSTNRSPKIRLAAIQGLADFGKMYPSHAKPALETLLSDANAEVRRAATNALLKVIPLP